jgi:hypothetical protein
MGVSAAGAVALGGDQGVLAEGREVLTAEGAAVGRRLAVLCRTHRPPADWFGHGDRDATRGRRPADENHFPTPISGTRMGCQSKRLARFSLGCLSPFLAVGHRAGILDPYEGSEDHVYGKWGDALQVLRPFGTHPLAEHPIEAAGYRLAGDWARLRGVLKALLDVVLH